MMVTKYIKASKHDIFGGFLYDIDQIHHQIGFMGHFVHTI